MKKLFSLITTLVVIGLLAGCGSNDDYYKSQLQSRDTDIDNLKNQIADYRAKLADYETKYHTLYTENSNIRVNQEPKVVVIKQDPTVTVHRVEPQLALPAPVTPTTPIPPTAPKNESSVLLPALVGVAAGIAGKHLYDKHKTTAVEKYRRSVVKTKIINLTSKYRKKK